MVSIRPHLWYADRALEAAEFYVSLFPEDSRITTVRVAPSGVPDIPEGTTFSVELTLGGVPVVALQGGPAVRLNEAFSFQVECDSQEEIDRYWAALIADGGAPGVCGWCTDRFGLSWQILPRGLDELVTGDDEASTRAREAMLRMTRLDAAELRAAYEGSAVTPG